MTQTAYFKRYGNTIAIRYIRDRDQRRQASKNGWHYQCKSDITKLKKFWKSEGTAYTEAYGYEGE